MRTERRRAARVEILGQIHGRLVTLEADVKVRELSLGGMSLESEIQFPEGAIHQFELFLGDGARVAVSAVARHSRPVPAGTGHRYLTGFQFIDDTRGEDSGVGSLIQRLD
jgi:hypothetical protein